MAEDKAPIDKIAHPMNNPGKIFSSGDAGFRDTLPAEPGVTPFVEGKLVCQFVHSAAYLVFGQCRLTE
ncbi:MAG: hypothetical protein M3N02_08570 [Pseudomonadota bacterium]|nr:hypothetical protein [Pseudomonadota bacterium]